MNYDKLPSADCIRESVTNPNTWERRFFRCYIDGSYLGYDHYKSNCQEVSRFFDDDSVLRACAINWFCDFIALEAGCHYSTAQKHMVSEVPRDVLEALNVELIDDLRDLVRYQFENVE